ncbi:MAG: HEPN domain-containing protein [Anaerolineales bacterium]|nr:HEPN domain-containing protein [Anaerolineales bacterium]
MNPLTLEWVEKAEGDFLTAGREYRVRKAPNYDAVCFHSQQAAEKYLKAILQESGKLIPRLHSLADLLALITKIDGSFLLLQADLNVMEGYAVLFRYPGLVADKVEAKAALQASKRVRAFTRVKLGL